MVAATLAAMVMVGLLWPALPARAQAAQPSFAPGPGSPLTTGGAGPFEPVSADFNGDGKPDLAVSNTNTRNVSVLLGDGSGGFGTPTTFDVGQVPEFLTSADLNGDGKVDLATANESSKDVSVLLNNAFIGDPAPSFARAANFDVGDTPIGITGADLNGDNKLDLAVATDLDHVAVLLNTAPTGAAASFTSATTFEVEQDPQLITSADLNGDKKPDLAVANSSSKNVSVLINTTSTGATTPSFGPATNFDVENGPEGIISADLNDDTKPDLAVANQIAGSSSVGSLSVLLNTTPFPIGGGGAVGGGGHHHKGHHHKGHHHH